MGFGGPITLVAQMQTDLVEKEKWQSKADFVQALALIKSMPGPLAFSTAAYLGTIRGGFWGGQIAGWSLVLPAFVMMILLASSYDKFSQIPMIVHVLSGMQAMALALIVFSIKSLAEGYLHRPLFWALVVAAILFTYLGLPEPLIILGLGIFGMLLPKKVSPTSHLFSAGVFALLMDDNIQNLFWICLKTGAFIFGSGLAMVPLLEHGFVQEMHWMTHSQFMDALAFGQMTPGPVLITVTFVGFKVAGILGATIATIAIFLASSVHMTTWFPRMTVWLSKQKWISSFILGALAAVVGTLVFVTGKLVAVSDFKQIGLVVLGMFILWKWKFPSWALITVGGLCGFLLYR